VFYVSRQCYFHDEGEYGVEIATARDHMSPDALASRYTEDLGEHEDPREAAEAAIVLAERWRKDVGAERLAAECFTIAGNPVCYPTVADALDADQVRAWAARRFDEMPHCERCGELAQAGAWIAPDGGDPVIACGQYCADALLGFG
jgi:hypothetical protein